MDFRVVGFSSKFLPANCIQIYWMTWWRAGNVLTAAPYQHRCGDATARVTFSATPVVCTAK